MVSGVGDVPGKKLVRLELQKDCFGRHYLDDEDEDGGVHDEVLIVDAVVVATGYVRNAHEDMLRSARYLMPGGDAPKRSWTVGRDYRVQMDSRKISPSAGIWLQGCNESTHGVSELFPFP